MKLLLSAFLLSLFMVGPTSVLASEYPEGGITIYNKSNNAVTAQVSAFGKFTLAANEVRNVAYSTLSQACSGNPANCRASFYINNNPVGSAIINVTTGKLIAMNLLTKVRTVKGPQNVLRSVIIK